MCRYINPFIDYGFKKLFATESNKDILISFINAVIEDTADPVIDLTYKNVEQIGEFNGMRDSYFDVYCETSQGRRFIVEMQNSWQPFFKDRTLFYAAKAIQDQGVKGDPTKQERMKEKSKTKKWNYRLNDRWLRVLYQLWGKEECPPELDEPVFHKLYEQAEYARFTPDQRLTYERSKKRELDIYNQIEGGRILGSEERATQIAQKMLAMGLDRAAIVEATGLSDDDF